MKMPPNYPPALPKVFRTTSAHVPDLFTGEVEVTEKIDGSQFCFGRNELGDIVTRSHGAYLKHDFDPMFEPAMDWVYSNQEIIKQALRPGTYVYGETLCKPHHNILTYSRVPTNNIIIFGSVFTVLAEDKAPLSNWFNYEELLQLGDVLGLEVVPLLFKGEIRNEDDLIPFLERDSILGGCKVEGVVIKNYTQFFFMGERKLPSFGKYVRLDFRELHETNWRAEKTVPGQVDALITGLKTEARWEKAVQHLEEAGKLEGIPRDIAALMIEIEQDFMQEEDEYVKKALFAIYRKRILQAIRRGAPEWYKRRLEEGSDG